MTVTPSEAGQLRVLQRRIQIALEVIESAQPPPPQALAETLVDALGRLARLVSGSTERAAAIER